MNFDKSVSIFAAVTIGLTETVYDVTEGDGAVVEVCATVFDGVLEREAEVTLQTADGSAVSQGIESDYRALTARLIFTSSMTEICRNITIINDMYYEDPESFNVLLTSDDPCVDVNPDMRTVTILDEDGKTVTLIDLSTHVMSYCSFSCCHWLC